MTLLDGQKSSLITLVLSSLLAPLIPYHSTLAESELTEVTINFAAKVGEQAFDCQKNYPNLGKSNATVAIADYRFYVSEIFLLDAQGNRIPLQLEQDNKWQYQNVALLDFEDRSGNCANGTPETRTIVVGKVPAGEYQGVEFTLGVPSALNHADASLAPSPLNLTSMWWNWQGGYKFLRIDIAGGDHTKGNSHQQQQGHSNEPFVIHIGSTGCQAIPTPPGYDCQNPNRAQVTLENFDPNSNVIVADLANLVAETDLTTNQPDTPTGCMSSPEDGDCLGLMQSIGLPFADQTPSEPSFWRVD